MNSRSKPIDSEINFDDDYDADEAAEPIKSEKKNVSMRLPDSKSGHPRTRFRNFSHVSEFSSGLETSNKPHKKRDKIEEFLEKKRERNTSRRLFGRNGT